ncbi:MAG TPA: hypothetical protein VFL82_16235 [Thermomicrobiales bacterium]|nr:hypothetical protein [Thermomicrobiales bacterium]
MPLTAPSHQISSPERRQTHRAAPDVDHLLGDGAPRETLIAPDLLQLQRTIGNRAVGRLLASKTPSEPATATPIQRLMTLVAFQTATPGSRRNKVLAIDQALQAYGLLPLTNFVNRNNQLTAIIHECDRYLGLSDKAAKRKPGVRQLRSEAAIEQRIVSRLALAEGEHDEIAKFRWLAEAREQFVEANGAITQSLGHLLNPLNSLTNACINSTRGTPKERQLIQDDLEELTRMRDDPTLPALLRNVLTEVLANVGQIKFEDSMPGATLSMAGVPEKYTIYHSLNQAGGQAERLGALTHELTHVAVSEKFNNTPLFLAFRPGAADDVIIALTAQRTQRLVEIEQALDADPRLTGEQKDLVRSKINYGKGNKLTQYAINYFSTRKINAGQRDFINDLATKANNAVIEYDTVVNQMLVYMARWQVPLNNALYTKIRDVVQEAFDYRRNA